jgi:acyl-CoA dehydrogenase
MTTLTELGEPYASIQREARHLAAEVEPFAVEADRSSVLWPDVLARLQASTLGELMVPAEHGGRFDDVDPLAVCVAREALMATCSHLDSLFALQGIGSYAITRGGTDAQRERWLPAVAGCTALAALALTEPVAGSDLKSITTTVAPLGDGLRLDGRKAFISNAGVAHFYTVLAREDAGLSLFLVPADRPGMSTEPSPDLIAPHVLGDVTFDGVELGPDDRLGAAGRGLDLVLSTLAVFRVSVGGAAVGLAQAALEEAVRHTRTREQFGRPLARHGPVASHLADAWADVAATRLLVYRAAELARNDPLGNLDHSSLAKLAATEAASRVVDRCVQVMGRWGLITDSKIERCYRQARPMRIYEGASEVLRLGIARHLCATVV